MRIVRRSLFWKIYITLLAGLITTTIFMGAFFWFLGEAQREGSPQGSFGERVAKFNGQRDVSLFDASGRLVGSRGQAIALSDYGAGRHWGPHVVRLDLPGGGFVLTRFGPPATERAVMILVIMLIAAGGVGLAAYPVTTLLTRRLEVLRAGVARWGEDAGHKGEAMAAVRFDESGSDEVAVLASTFNAAAARIGALLASQKALLANASHELRSPLARLRVAVEMGEHQVSSRAEIVRNLAEMDQLVDELLLSSRLDHPGAHRDRRESIDLLGLAAEEAARTDAIVIGEPVDIVGDAVLLRRLVRNLLENGIKHGRAPVTIAVAHRGGGAEMIVSDTGGGIEPGERERIFEPFYRPAGSGEATGGWGLGLALVRQIAERHGGSVECCAAPSGASYFIVRLQLA